VLPLFRGKRRDFEYAGCPGMLSFTLWHLWHGGHIGFLSYRQRCFSQILKHDETVISQDHDCFNLAIKGV
jgi:hypothetical protein